jgi:hypothetical protein
LDSGASFHTTTIREILEYFVAGDFRKVYLADRSALDIVGMSDVRIRVHSDSVWKLQKEKNLISVGQLDDEGHSANFQGGKWKVSIGARILAQGYKTSTLYMTTNIKDVAFRYRFWPDQNRKIIRSKNVTFNENALYKNDSSAEPARIEFEAEKPEFINLDGIPKGPAAHRMNSDAEEGLEVDDTTNQQIEQGPPVVAVRRSHKY